MIDNLPSTDHFAIEFLLSVGIPVQYHCQRTLYDYKKADFNAFREVLSHIPWDIVSDGDDIEYSWSRAGATILQVVRLNLCHHCQTYTLE